MKRKSEGLSPGKENIPTPARKRTRKGLEEDKSQIKMDLYIKKKETNWKNIYKQYKENQEQAVTKVENILKETKMTKENDLDLLKIIEYCTLEFSWDVDKGAVLASLKQHCLYEKAVACVSNRLQKMMKTVKGMASSVFCGIVFLSRGVVDIKNLVKCLTKTNPKMNIDKIMEKLYWLAALLYSRREHTYIKRLHFNICYYLNQKEHLRAHGNIRKKQSFHATKEQEEILNHPLGSNDVVKVEAFAGTGKTRTLIEYAKKKSELKFLYLAFTNTTINKAKKTFPKNVTCKTFHSLAEKERQLYEKMNKLTYNNLTLPMDTSEQDHFVNKMVLETLLNFLASADDKISKEHPPTNYKNENGQTVETQEHMLTDVLEKANLRWENMKSLNKTESYIDKMTPDGYFKLWQLSNPILDNCNAIFVDDVTNCTPAMIKVVLSQQCGKIFVGDPNLHIYTFRGAKNNLSTIPSTHNFNLTQIIRFGSKIAFAAAAILKHTKKMEDQSVVGINNTVGFIRIFPRSSSSSRNARGHVLESKAILCRTNKKIFDEAVRLTKKTKEGTQPTINIIGGLGTYGLTVIHDIWRLRNGGKELQAIKDKYINTWKAKGFYALKDCARRTENKKLLWKIEIVEEYSNRIPELVQRISNCYTCIKQKTDYFISTLHKAKGMEFDTVIIPDEYNNIETELKQWKMLQTPNEDVQPADAEGRDDTTETIQPEDEDEEMDQMEETIQSGDENEEIDEAEDLPEQDEWSLLYVAVTCAKKNLVLPKCIKTILSLSGEHFLRPMWTSKILKGGPVMCKQCRKPLCKDTILTMKKMPIVFSDGREDAGGYFCIACVEPLVGPLISLIASPVCEINATQ